MLFTINRSYDCPAFPGSRDASQPQELREMKPLVGAVGVAVPLEWLHMGPSKKRPFILTGNFIVNLHTPILGMVHTIHKQGGDLGLL